jgi:hypothetical protein
MPRPETQEESREVERQGHMYHAMHTRARDEFITLATQQTPRSAMQHDSGLTWAKYHAYVFDTVNPIPRVITKHLKWDTPLPASFHPTLAQPCSLRWGIIGHNKLRPIKTKRELQLYLAKMNEQ